VKFEICGTFHIPQFFVAGKSAQNDDEQEEEESATHSPQGKTDDPVNP
jgi:hypothetical protein